MERVKISIEINGKQQHAGTIEGNSYADARFTYSDHYRELEGIKPISVNLPLQKEPFSTERTKAFFEGLLPEGFSRRAVANWAKADENDYLSILKSLGQECLGAIQVSEEGVDIPVGRYELLSPERVKALASEGATTSTLLLMETHLSLTGATGKVGLYYDEVHNNWYLPIGNSASTHIVKQSHIRLDQIVLNEQLCILAAKNIGIEVPDSFIVNIGDAKDEDVLYATQRYDREITENVSVDGLPVPFRLHQEDFAQALGIPAYQKYETEKKGYLKMMFNLIRKQSVSPLEDQIKLWDRVIFNYLIGNTDCHLKNYSLLYNSSLKGIRLAPAYDIVCTRAYQSTKDMSFFIGDEINIEKIRRSHFEQAAKEIGLGPKLAMKRFDLLADKFEDALKEATREVKEKGFRQAESFQERILAGCGYRNDTGGRC